MVEEICHDAFQDNKYLRRIYIPAATSEICGQNAFEGCENLCEICVDADNKAFEMNKLQEFIEKLEMDTDRSELNEKLLQMLLEKQRELGDNISDEEAEEAAGEVFKEHLLEALRSVVPNVEV